MYRKILFWNVFASVVVRVVALLFGLAGFNAFVLGEIGLGVLLFFIALAFFLSGMGVYIDKKWVMSGIKIFFIIVILVSVVAILVSLGENMTWVSYYMQKNMYATQPMSFPFGVWEAMLILTILLLVSFIFSVEHRMKRLKTPFDQLPDYRKTSIPPWRVWLMMFVSLVVLVPVYFVIGKFAQRVPEVSVGYFEKTWVNPNLPDEESGYVKLGDLLGRMTDVPFVKTVEMELVEKLGVLFYDERRQVWVYKFPSNVVQREDRYETLAEVFLARSELVEAIVALEESDFFNQLGAIASMEWRDNDSLPNIDIQTVFRTIKTIALYKAEQGDVSSAVAYNVLSLRLADKYFSDYASVIKGLVGMVTFGIAMDATQYLLDNYTLSAEDLEVLQEVYSQILLTDVETAYQNIFKGEYHAMMQWTNGFDIDPWEYLGYWLNDGDLWSMLGLLLYREPFYNVRDTQARYAFVMSKFVEGVLFEEVHSEVMNRSRNLYNILGDRMVDIYLPRLQVTWERLDMLYQKRASIQTQLQSTFVPEVLLE